MKTTEVAMDSTVLGQQWQKAGIVQIEALLREAILDLEETKNIYHMIQNGAYS